MSTVLHMFKKYILVNNFILKNSSSSYFIMKKFKVIFEKLFLFSLDFIQRVELWRPHRRILEILPRKRPQTDQANWSRSAGPGSLDDAMGQVQSLFDLSASLVVYLCIHLLQTKLNGDTLNNRKPEENGACTRMPQSPSCEWMGTGNIKVCTKRRKTTRFLCLWWLIDCRTNWIRRFSF